ncbi:Carbon-nitrogen hydrolase [Streptomyces sp. 2231.1]|nr:Carbon-nitrogen hydrolase [Streptomyces sp. 2231.1]
MRASLIQLSVGASDFAGERRLRAASLVRCRAGDDLVVLPELWAAGAWSYDRWERDAEGVDGPTAEAMSAAARRAGVWLHAGSIVERDGDGTLYNTALLFDRAGELRGRYRKIHRYGFGTGEATLMGGGDDIVTVPTGFGVTGLAICYDLRFPELLRGLLDAGAELVVVPAAPPPASATGNSSPVPRPWRNRSSSWPAARRAPTATRGRPDTAWSSTRGGPSWARPAQPRRR